MDDRIIGVNLERVRKALLLILFGVKEKDGKYTYHTDKLKYIIPNLNRFELPDKIGDKDTYCMFWISEDESLTQDAIIEEGDENYNETSCVATIALRFVGAHAEDWAKTVRHYSKREGVYKIWYGVCNAEKIDWVSRIKYTALGFSGNNSEVAVDISMKLYYREQIRIDWSALKGIDFAINGEIK